MLIHQPKPFSFLSLFLLTWNMHLSSCKNDAFFHFLQIFSHPPVFVNQLVVSHIFLWWYQFSSVAQSCLTLCDPMNHSTPGLLIHHQLLEFTQTHVHRVSDAIQPSHPLLSPSPPALNLSQHQGLLKWVSSLHQMVKVLKFQPQHQSFQRTPRTGLL